jgi:hypothetical protein
MHGVAGSRWRAGGEGLATRFPSIPLNQPVYVLAAEPTAFAAPDFEKTNGAVKVAEGE